MIDGSSVVWVGAGTGRERGAGCGCEPLKLLAVVREQRRCGVDQVAEAADVGQAGSRLVCCRRDGEVLEFGVEDVQGGVDGCDQRVREQRCAAPRSDRPSGPRAAPPWNGSG